MLCHGSVEVGPSMTDYVSAVKFTCMPFIHVLDAICEKLNEYTM